MSVDAVYLVLASVPPGRVITYGELARLAGLGRGARQVGRILQNLPPDTQLPWHRVINSQGRISLPATSPAHALQKEKLQREGVIFRRDRIDLKVFGWVSAHPELG